ncbi:MAG: DUF3343 domain-containing protein [Oscillospiraceae bacterium]|nr:DUF3343 domain-containing protein [Oscillospiraceae bacterium]
MYYYIVCKTLTYSQRMSRFLDKNKIQSQIKRLPSELRERNGCGYAVRVGEKDLKRAVELLREAEIAPVRVYCHIESGGEEIEI